MSTLQTHKITNFKKWSCFVYITWFIKCQPSSVNKDCSNLSKPCFGCCYCCSFVNFKNIIIFWNIRYLWLMKKLKKCCFWFGTYKKRFIIRDSKLLNLIPDYSLIKYFNIWLLSVLSTFLTCTAGFCCIFWSLQMSIEPLFMVIFISMACQVLSGCSSGHLASTFDQICKLILKDQTYRWFGIKKLEILKIFFIHFPSYFGKDAFKTVNFIIIC